MSVYPPLNSGRWTTGLFGCFEDCESCLLGACCPCVLIGRTAEIIDQGATSCCAAGTVFCCLQCWTGCGFLFTCSYRSRLRQKFGLPASPCGDCLVDCCCLNCSACQLHRELENRGVDPRLGYAAVQHVYDRPGNAQPPVQQFMKH